MKMQAVENKVQELIENLVAGALDPRPHVDSGVVWINGSPWCISLEYWELVDGEVFVEEYGVVAGYPNRDSVAEIFVTIEDIAEYICYGTRELYKTR